MTKKDFIFDIKIMDNEFSPIDRRKSIDFDELEKMLIKYVGVLPNERPSKDTRPRTNRL